LDLGHAAFLEPPTLATPLDFLPELLGELEGGL
jgi:hypothetical protein